MPAQIANEEGDWTFELLQLRTGVAVDFGAERNFNHLRGVPVHACLRLLFGVLLGSASLDAVAGVGDIPHKILSFPLR